MRNIETQRSLNNLVKLKTASKWKNWYSSTDPLNSRAWLYHLSVFILNFDKIQVVSLLFPSPLFWQRRGKNLEVMRTDVNWQERGQLLRIYSWEPELVARKISLYFILLFEAITSKQEVSRKKWFTIPKFHSQNTYISFPKDRNSVCQPESMNQSPAKWPGINSLG